MKPFYVIAKPIWQQYHRRRYLALVRQANQLEDSVTGLSDEALREQLLELRRRAQGLASIKHLIPQALALGRETSRRVLGMRHYDVQLVGTLALFEGHIAEMETGEGKTLMAPLAAFLHAMENARGSCHIVTANEYLAQRDAEWMGPFYEALGLRVGLIVPGQRAEERIAAYQQPVVYATAREVVFDSLKEPLRKRRTGSVEAILRPRPEQSLNPVYDFAIVDEVDSVLIDQARSPLAVGGASDSSPQLAVYRHADDVAGQLTRGAHYRMLQDDRKVELKEEGKAEARRRAGKVLRLLPPGHTWERYVTCALAARYLYKRDMQYVVRENRVVLIDESTGRLMPGRQLPDGIHQAIEVRNGLTPTSELKGTMQTTFQTFFRQYKKLAGMTGTASREWLEFLSVYELSIIPIPTNRPMQRHFHEDKVFRSKRAKYAAIVDEIERVHLLGRPVLVGTGSVQISEYLGQLLVERGLEHDILNAKNHHREAAIIAEAGKPGRITIITNMAGRGVDIKLGEGVASRGGMFLLGTDRLPFRRFDDQLMGRVGRQGDPADCQFFLCLRDDLLRYADRNKVTRLRVKTRDRRNEPIASSEAAKLFHGIQHHIRKVTRKQRQLMYQGEKHREKLKEEGLWEDWMDHS